MTVLSRVARKLTPSRRVQLADEAIVERIVAQYLKPGVINLAPGSASWCPPVEMMPRSPRPWRPENSRYGDCHGSSALLASLRDKLAHENGHDMSRREVMVTNGANQAYVSALLTLCDPGDEARLERSSN